MSKILLTGMTAAQVSQSAQKRSRTYAWLLNEALTRAGHTVHWSEPWILWRPEHLADYDSVLVGLAPVTGLGANRAYGALTTIDTLWGDPRLRFFLDAPNPEQVTSGINAIIRNPNNINKDFYSYRKDYEEACRPETRLKLYTAVRKLATEIWPTTIYPSLPWEQIAPDIRLPLNAYGKTVGVNLDAITLETTGYKQFPGAERWVSDDPKSAWVQEIAKTLEYGVENVKLNKFSTDSEVDYQMANSIGVLLAPTKKKATWWSNRYAQAMSVGVPIVTEWRESGELGPEWSVLASQIERVSDERRWELAKDQRESYTESIPRLDEATQHLEETLGLRNEGTE